MENTSNTQPQGTSAQMAPIGATPAMYPAQAPIAPMQPQMQSIPQTGLQQASGPQPQIAQTNVENVPQNSWRDMLPETMRDNPLFSKYASLEEFAKAYQSATSLLGKRSADFTPEDWQSFAEFNNMSIGAPEHAEDYKIDTRPIDENVFNLFNEDDLGEFRQLAKDLNLTQETAQRLYDSINSKLCDVISEIHQNQCDVIQDEINKVEKAWGAQWENKINAVQRCAMDLIPSFGREDMQKCFDDLIDSGLLNKAWFLNFLAGIGETIGESRSVGYSNVNIAPMDAQVQLAQMEQSPEIMSIINNVTHPEHQRWLSEYRRLCQIAYDNK